MNVLFYFISFHFFQIYKWIEYLLQLKQYEFISFTFFLFLFLLTFISPDKMSLGSGRCSFWSILYFILKSYSHKSLLQLIFVHQFNYLFRRALSLQLYLIGLDIYSIGISANFVPSMKRKSYSYTFVLIPFIFSTL